MWVTVHDNGKPVLINLQNALGIKQIGNNCIVIFENSNMIIDESFDCIKDALQDDRRNYIWL